MPDCPERDGKVRDDETAFIVKQSLAFLWGISDETFSKEFSEGYCVCLSTARDVCVITIYNAYPAVILPSSKMGCMKEYLFQPVFCNNVFCVSLEWVEK